MAERYSSFESGGTRWFLQRVTAAFLIFVLAFHFFLLHFLNHAENITFGMSQARMSQWTYFSLMVLFIITAAFHGVNGIYNALVNQGLTGSRKRAMKWVLIVAGAILIIQGLRTAVAWTTLFT